MCAYEDLETNDEYKNPLFHFQLIFFLSHYYHQSTCWIIDREKENFSSSSEFHIKDTNLILEDLKDNEKTKRKLHQTCGSYGIFEVQGNVLVMCHSTSVCSCLTHLLKYAGHLEKLGSGLFGRWQKHFFKLNNHHLVYYKSQKAYSNEMLPLNNYDLKFMEKWRVRSDVRSVRRLRPTSKERKRKKFRAQTPSIAGEWVRETDEYHDLMMHSEDVSSTSRDVVA